MKDWRGTPLRAGQRLVVCHDGQTLGLVTEVDEATHTFAVRRFWPPAEMVITEDFMLDGFLEVAVPDGG
jgi:cation transport regulator ChaC